MKHRKCLSKETSESLLEQFSGTSRSLTENGIKNDKLKRRTYIDELKKFASKVHLYSPRAYLYLRKILQLPHPSSVREWTATINCEPGYFTDLQRKFETVKDYTDCCLMIDGMTIRKQMSYAGFIDYGNLSVENGEENTSEALVFMLTGLKTYWKCPIGHVLTNKCNSETQTSLLKNCLSLAADHGLKVWSVQLIANKLNSDHLNWQRQKKKKVKLAAQALSFSTAAALQFLQQKIKHKKFINCTDTIVFV